MRSGRNRRLFRSWDITHTFYLSMFKSFFFVIASHHSNCRDVSVHILMSGYQPTFRATHPVFSRPEPDSPPTRRLSIISCTPTAAEMDPTDPTAFNHRFVKVASGHRYHLIDQAPLHHRGPISEAPTLLLAHGFPDSWYGWRYRE